MSTLIDFYDCAADFEDMLQQAEMAAVTKWEMDFIGDLSSKYGDYGEEMFLLDRQVEILERIAGASR